MTSTQSEATETVAVADRIWTVPNAISLLRLLLVPVFAILLTKRYDIAALVVLMFSGWTDWLDGAIARKYNQVSRLGQLLDPAADRLFILVTLVALALREILPVWLVVVIVGREVLLAAFLPAWRRMGYWPLPVHFAGKAGTFALLYAFPLLFLSSWPGAIGLMAAIFGWAFAGWGIGLYWLSAVLYIRQFVTLRKTWANG
jgi:cardiolipin synthase